MIETSTVHTIATAVGTTLAFGFILCFIVGLFVGEEGGIQAARIPEHIELARIDDDYDELADLKRQVEIMKLKQQLAGYDEPAKPTVDNSLAQDCISALVSMGEKKSAARSKVHKFLQQNPNVKSVSEFISKGF